MLRRDLWGEVKRDPLLVKKVENVTIILKS